MIPVLKTKDAVEAYYSMYQDGACVLEWNGRSVRCKNKKKAMKMMLKLKMK